MARMVALLSPDTAFLRFLVGVLYNGPPVMPLMSSWLELEFMRAWCMVLVISANAPSLVGSVFGLRLERVLVSLAMSARPFRPLVLKQVPAVVMSQCFEEGRSQ